MSELTSKSPDDDILLRRTEDIDSNKLTGVYDAVSNDFLVVNELIPKLLSSEVDLVEEIGGTLSIPKILLIASTSTTSPAGVDVP